MTTTFALTEAGTALAVEQSGADTTIPSQETAASVVVAHHARDKDDLTDLLGALGLPCTEDDLVRLLPYLSANDHPQTGDTMPTNADTAEHVRTTLGLSDSELAVAAQHADLPTPNPASAPTSNDASQTADVRPNGTANSGGIEALLSWAKNHSAATIRNRAARIRSDLTELTDRRATEAAQHEAEERVAKAKAELEAAQAQLRKVKTNGRTAAATSAATTPDPVGKRSKEELAAIRTWARANGHRVADRGTPAKAVLDAYDAAHLTTNLAEAS